MATNKNPWYRSRLIKGFLILAFLPFSLTYYIAKNNKFQSKQKLQYIALVWIVFFVIGGVSSLLKGANPEAPAVSATPIEVKHVENQQAQPSENTINATEAELSDSSFERINEIVLSKAGVEPEVYSGDEFADETNPPYEVFVNLPFDHSVSNCFMAKTLSVEVLKSLYMDNVVRPDIDRVIVSIPYYLRVSLGASDGVPMAENNVFNGPTVYWNTLEQFGLGENETGSLENRTWGVYLAKCSE